MPYPCGCTQPTACCSSGSPERLQVVIAGVANEACVPEQGSQGCLNFNGTWILNRVSDCVWESDILEDPMCDEQGIYNAWVNLSIWYDWGTERYYLRVRINMTSETGACREEDCFLAESETIFDCKAFDALPVPPLRTEFPPSCCTTQNATCQVTALP